ncbi:MAG: M64 family metallopeptidase [Thermoproteota archaeon]
MKKSIIFLLLITFLTPYVMIKPEFKDCNEFFLKHLYVTSENKYGNYTLQSLELNIPPYRGLDIIFIPANFSWSEIEAFKHIVEKCRESLLSTRPFSDYRNIINVWVIYCSIDFQISFNRASRRVYSKNYYRIVDFVKEATKDYFSLDFDGKNPDDQIIVLVKTQQYGGDSSPPVSVSYIGADWGISVFLHEFGHSFANLPDEYPPNRNPDPLHKCVMEDISVMHFCPICEKKIAELLQSYSPIYLSELLESLSTINGVKMEINEENSSSIVRVLFNITISREACKNSSNECSLENFAINILVNLPQTIYLSRDRRLKKFELVDIIYSYNTTKGILIPPMENLSFVIVGVPLNISLNKISMIIEYRKQYLLDVSSPYGFALGSGWYDEGVNASFSIFPTVIDNGLMVFYFSGWRGDLESHSPTGTIIMNSPKRLIAEWREDFTKIHILLALMLIIGVCVALKRVLKFTGFIRRSSSVGEDNRSF